MFVWAGGFRDLVLELQYNVARDFLLKSVCEMQMEFNSAFEFQRGGIVRVCQGRTSGHRVLTFPRKEAGPLDS